MRRRAGARRGAFLVVDGPDGAGKTTQVRRLARRLRRLGRSVVTVRDPGGTPIGESVRRLLLDRRSARMSLRTETLLYMASRAQLLDEVVRPALARGAIVLSDRFLTSTVAYQGFGGRVGGEAVRALGRFAIRDTEPDLVLLLDLDPREGLRRLGRRRDRIEARALPYHRRVRRGFLLQARDAPRRLRVIDAAGGADAVEEAIWREVERVLA